MRAPLGFSISTEAVRTHPLDRGQAGESNLIMDRNIYVLSDHAFCRPSRNPHREILLEMSHYLARLEFRRMR
jgi:hypothetical protein